MTSSSMPEFLIITKVDFNALAASQEKDLLLLSGSLVTRTTIVLGVKYVVVLSSVTVLDQAWPQISCTGAYHGFLEDPSDHLL